MSKKQKYSPHLKKKVAQALLSGEQGGAQAIARRFGITNKSQVKTWVKIYAPDPQLLEQDHRGRKSTGRPKTLKLEEMTLDAELEFLRMENTIIKKWVQLTSWAFFYLQSGDNKV
ncbi:transposase [Lactococcus lactis subsp. lactis]|uniref:helix-turn-helix domain-containing protein n=1 Tax=Lactococcus lactis TaxID=1358 RepID=UPI00223B8216|nr:helix-turn-helix domain-containing protein [Lactococcus lactis]MCT0017721.1 transposase [Lactococcus lactis subsp. lactis]